MKVVITSAKRTPIGKFGGVLNSLSAVDLGTIAAKAAIKQSGIDPKEIQQTIFGSVIQANQGQNLSRQIALKSGLSTKSSAMTINEVCGSGLKAVRLGQAAIEMGDAEVVLVGGTESMSNAPFYVPNLRFNHKLGSTVLVDSLEKDVLQDAFTSELMGSTAEYLASKFHVTRIEQDKFALSSHKKAIEAQRINAFYSEIAPTIVQTKHGEEKVVVDEGPRNNTDLVKLGNLKSVYADEGTITAGNSSPINDGAAALILMSEDKAKELKIPYIATINDYNEEGVNPDLMGIAPVSTIKSMLHRTNQVISDFDLFEINEAFASQSLIDARLLNIPLHKLNVNGGSIALGHPVGASGARILVTLLYALKQRQLHSGLAALCIGGGLSAVMSFSL